MGAQERVTLRLGPTGTIAAGTGDVWYERFGLPGKWYVVSAHHVPNDAQTANGTNYSTYTLKNGATTLATRAYSATDSVAGTPEALTISEGSNKVVADGDVLSWTKAESGTGLAGFNHCVLVLERRDLP